MSFKKLLHFIKDVKFIGMQLFIMYPCYLFNICRLWGSKSTVIPNIVIYFFTLFFLINCRFSNFIFSKNKFCFFKYIFSIIYLLFHYFLLFSFFLSYSIMFLTFFSYIKTSNCIFSCKYCYSHILQLRYALS